MLKKLKDTDLVKQDLDRIDRFCKTVNDNNLEQQANNLKQELVRLIDLCDEYHSAENRRWVSIPMLEDLRTDLINTRKSIDGLIRKSK